MLISSQSEKPPQELVHGITKSSSFFDKEHNISLRQAQFYDGEFTVSNDENMMPGGVPSDGMPAEPSIEEVD